MNPLTADRRFFAGLIAGDPRALDRIPAEDFLLIDVMNGSEISKPAFLAAIASGRITFDSIEPPDNRVRLYQTTAVITGSTQMAGLIGDIPPAASSRYTHIFADQQGEWLLVTAQGT